MSDHEQSMFAFADDVSPTASASVPDPVERRRLGGQSASILALLERGPVTNVSLSQIALKYTSRISDLRKAGHKIEAFDRDTATGVVWYRLMNPERTQS